MREHEYFDINKIEKGPFKYVLSTGPIDYFFFSLTREQLKENIESDGDGELNSQAYKRYLNGYTSINELEDYIKEIVAEIEEEPHTICYFGIPQPSEFSMELALIAKIDNNGTCFIFSNNKEFLKMVKRDND